MTRTIRVAILDDHQSIVDGYQYRLGQAPHIEIVGTARYGAQLFPMLAERQVDVLILDVQVPTSPDNPAAYPILHIIPSLLQTHPGLTVLIISMIAERALIQAVMDAGASGYILKDDGASIQELSAVLTSVASGGFYLSQQAHELLFKHRARSLQALLTRRQLEALSLCAAHPNSSSAVLADRLGVTYSTFRNLLSTSYSRLGVRSRAAAVARAAELGLITPPARRPPNS